MHQFDAGQHTSSCPERLESQHVPDVSFDGPVILISPHGVVDVLDLANVNRKVLVLNNLIESRFVGAALVHGDFLKDAIGLHGLLKKPYCCILAPLRGQQEIDCFACLRERTVEVLPNALARMYVSSILQLNPTGRL